MSGVEDLNVSEPYRLIVSVNLDRRHILVVGGGATAERKVATLLRTGAHVKVVSPTLTDTLRRMAERGDIAWEARTALASDFEEYGMALLTVPKDDAADLIAMARAHRCLLDVCSDGRQGDFALCAQFEMNDCYVGISSGGSDPVRAAALKREFLDRGRTSSDARTIRIAESTGRASPVRVLTRNSPLALAQANLWLDALAGVGVRGVKRTVTSHGDRDRKSDLASFGGFGAFVKALEEELMAGRGECAVHSLKDMPVGLPDGCVLAAVLRRDSSRDVIITRDGSGLDSLPAGAVIGTSSLRRRAQVRLLRRDLACVTCRGNIETRLEKLKNGEIDAIILAEAGLNRLGIEIPNMRQLPFVTAAGQGAIAVEVRAGSAIEETARSLNHRATWYEVTAERELLRLMGFGCACPVGVHGKYVDNVLDLTASVYSIEPMENPEDEHVTLRVRGHVESERGAKQLASRLWDEMRDMPLIRALASLSGERAS